VYKRQDLYASKSDFHYKITNPKVLQKDPAGSGDAFVAGIILGLEKSLIFNDFVKIAASLGSYNASVWETCRVKKENADRLLDEVVIMEIGKKIKLIDDSPTV
jgi:tagatose 6-phosphate kinase